ncbi:MAG: efflux RND transporter permease subunit [Gemmatimonadetes bacterium]|nr:efflux RND transporter permease subunit [Gemmatimonadota bacterium]
MLQVEDSILKTFPEVESVWGKAGRANTATDWAPMSMVETIVNLKPESEWRPGMTQDRLTAEMDRALRLTGMVNTWTMPIKNRTDMLSTGVRTTLAVKIFGPDLETMQRVGQDLERVLAPLVPVLWSHGTGASVMKRIAAPMVGGMVTSTVLTLVVIPVLYYLWRRRS